jgi:hypothetical protein
VTDHTHVRDAELHYVDRDTCVHRLVPYTTPEQPWDGGAKPIPRLHGAAQCPRQPSFIIDSYPTCDGHVVAVVVWMHERRPDVVVRRWP